MSPELSLYYQHESIQSLANACQISRVNMIARLLKERRRLGLSVRERTEHLTNDILEFMEDRDMVIQLAKDGMSFLEIAKKWDIDQRTVSKYLSRWGMIIDANTEIDSIGLNDLYTGWADIRRGTELILTINRKPMFKLVRIL